MSETWVVNASPIITLAKVGHLGLLTGMDVDLRIPETVARELLAGPLRDPARLALESGWGQRVAAPSIPEEVLEWGLGAGESAVLALALDQPDSVALVDDGGARKCAQVLGIAVMGTLGVVIRAKLKGLIPSATQTIHALRAAGLYIDERTIRDALAKTTEEPWEPPP